MRPERFTAWILATALCAAAPAVQGAPDAATRTSAATALSLQDARTRLLQVSDQLAAARAAVESKRLQTQGLQGLDGPIVGLSASHTRYSLHGELDLAKAKQELGNRLSELGPLAQPVGQLATLLPQAIPDAPPYHLKGTRNSQAISAVWPVYTGGATQAVKDFSAAQQDEAQADAQATTHQLEDTLVQRYFGVQLARRAVALRQQAASTIAEHDHAAERLLQVGMIARVDRLQASVALEQARREQLKAQGDLALAQAALQSLLHSEQAVQPSTPLFVDTRPLPPLEQFRQLALGHHPGLDKVAAKKAQAEQLHALEKTRAGSPPSRCSAGANYSATMPAGWPACRRTGRCGPPWTGTACSRPPRRRSSRPNAPMPRCAATSRCWSRRTGAPSMTRASSTCR